MAIPTSNQNFIKHPARVKIVTTLPALEEAELGEIYLLTADGRLYIRTTSGYGYTAALTGSTGAA